MIVGVDWKTRRLSLACPSVGLVWSTRCDLTRDRREFVGEHEAGAEMGRRALVMLCERGLVRRPGGVEFWAERPVTLRGPNQNVRTAVGSALSLGAVTALLPGRVHIIESSQWKEAVVGHGSSSKDDVQHWLTTHRPALAALAGTEDERDALCIALFGHAVVEARDLPGVEHDGLLRAQA